MNNLLQLVDPRWHGDFQTFIETGESPTNSWCFSTRIRTPKKLWTLHLTPKQPRSKTSPRH